MTWLRAVTKVLGLVVCFAGAIAASPTQDDTYTNQPTKSRPPWGWTTAERAHARRDSEKRRERLAVFAAKERSQLKPSNTTTLPAEADIIDGSRNPELFFVTELFEILVRSSFVTLPEAYPHVVRQRSSDLFRDPEEWNQFAVIVREYAEVLRQQKTAADALDLRRVSEIHDLGCYAASHALREARRTFGRARFDQMLYETIPVSMITTFSADTDFEQSIGKAQEREERCQ